MIVGDCHLAAFDLLETLGPDAVLVQARVGLPPSCHPGWHSWVEVGPVAHDGSAFARADNHGEPMVVPSAELYRRYRPTDVRRFTRAEAFKLLIETGTYGIYGEPGTRETSSPSMRAGAPSSRSRQGD